MRKIKRFRLSLLIGFLFITIFTIYNVFAYDNYHVLYAESMNEETKIEEDNDLLFIKNIINKKGLLQEECVGELGTAGIIKVYSTYKMVDDMRYKVCDEQIGVCMELIVKDERVVIDRDFPDLYYNNIEEINRECRGCYYDIASGASFVGLSYDEIQDEYYPHHKNFVKSLFVNSGEILNKCIKLRKDIFREHLKSQTAPKTIASCSTILPITNESE